MGYLRYNDYDYVNFKDLEGKTITDIKGTEGDDELRFAIDDGVYVMHHQQDCCEHVYLSEVVGDLQDLIGSPILQAEAASEAGEDGEYGDTSTWTFYKLATIKGSVTLRWLGSSNGYYSEGVDFVKLKSCVNQG